MLFRTIRRNRWRDAVLYHGRVQHELEFERGALGDGWPEERERLSALIESKERKLETLRAKLRETA